MVIIWPCPLAPSNYAEAGRGIVAPSQACPGCSRQLTDWGGYWRWVRSGLIERRIWIRRGWCAPCGRTQALLPSFLFVRRLDEGAVIGAALTLVASGHGARRVARQLAVPRSTIRGWWQRVRARAALVVADLLALATRLDSAPVHLTAGGVPGVLRALDSAWQRAHERLGARIPDQWAFWSLVSGGLALAANRSPPFPGGPGTRKVGASP